MRHKYLWSIVALLFLILFMAAAAHAAAVGRFTLVEGQVDILKQGKVPAVPAKLQDGVEPGDVIRTKSKSKAQVKFMDDSVVTMAPESRIAVADFTFDATTGQRHAVLRFFKGVVHTVVTRLLKVQEPDFIMETHTAVMGVRGTENYSLLLPNATGAYLIDGLLEVRSNNPKILGTILLKDKESSMIPLNQSPGMAKPISPAMEGMLKNLINTGLKESAFLGAGAGPGLAGGSTIPQVVGIPGSAEKTLQTMQPVIPPQVVPPVVTSPAPAQTSPSRGGGSPTGSITP